MTGTIAQAQPRPNTEAGMCTLEGTLRSMTFEFLGTGGHKVAHADLFAAPDAVVLDVRTREEAESLAFPLRHQVREVIQIPLNELPDRLDELPPDCPIGILCVSDVRSAIAFAYLRAKGCTQARILAGGTAALVAELKTGKVREHIYTKDATS